jgi:hypothetical protein
MTCNQFRPFIVDLARGAIDAAAIEADVDRHVRGCDDCRRLLERERIMSAALRRVAQIDVPGIDPVRERALLTAFDTAIAVSNNGSRYRIWLPAAAAVLLITSVVAWKLPFRAGTAGQNRHTASASALPRMSPDAHRNAGDLKASELDARARTPSRPEHVVERPAPAIPPSSEAAQPSPRRRRANRAADEVRDATFEQTSFVAWPYANAGPPLESGSVKRVDLPVSILPALGLWPPASGEATVAVEILVGQDGFARAFRLVEQ